MSFEGFEVGRMRFVNHCLADDMKIPTPSAYGSERWVPEYVKRWAVHTDIHGNSVDVVLGCGRTMMGWEGATNAKRNV